METRREESHRIANKRRTSARHSSFELDATASDVLPSITRDIQPIQPLTTTNYDAYALTHTPLNSPSISAFSSLYSLPLYSSHPPVLPSDFPLFTHLHLSSLSFLSLKRYISLFFSYFLKL